MNDGSVALCEGLVKKITKEQELTFDQFWKKVLLSSAPSKRRTSMHLRQFEIAWLGYLCHCDQRERVTC